MLIANRNVIARATDSRMVCEQVVTECRTECAETLFDTGRYRMSISSAEEYCARISDGSRTSFRHASIALLHTIRNHSIAIDVRSVISIQQACFASLFPASRLMPFLQKPILDVDPTTGSIQISSALVERMPYFVKELFYTLQGEGRNTGRPAIFCRFAGCNLWSGHEMDRASAICQFCDTAFVGINGPGGGRFDARDLALASIAMWRSPAIMSGTPFIVLTGGEPLLQLDQLLVDELHTAGFEIAVETNGTRIPPNGIDWICVSPKAGADLVIRSGDELKLIFPQEGAEPERYSRLDFQYFFLQPMDGPDVARNTRLAVEFCLEHPQWRLSLQTHKILAIP